MSDPIRNIPGLITRLRAIMIAEGIDATVIPQNDPHQSEYLAEHWQARRYLSGFTGSAGSLVVTLSESLLWTDSRYFIQAAAQLEGSGIQLVKALPGTPTIDQYLADTLAPGSTVGINGLLFSYQAATTLSQILSARDIKLNLSFDPIPALWPDRPVLPDSPLIPYPESFAGESPVQKLDWLRQHLADNNADAILISALDEIAWLLNIRSRDVIHTPVVTSYLYVTRSGATTLFIDTAKLTPDAQAHLTAAGVRTAPYDSILEFITSATEPLIAVDPATTSALMMATVDFRALHLPSPVPLRKAVKNEVETAGFRAALLRDSVALVKAHIELGTRFHQGEPLTEMDVCDIWHRHRANHEFFFDESFDTIAGYGPNGAIVHYSPSPVDAATLGSDSLLLIDSGAQYLDGTTDITRTICLGQPTPDQRHNFTLVLKGNISLARAIFPVGTRGAQLDILAHQPLWREGLNYLHGTGHGVGHFLGVHEGPHQIRMNDIPTPLRPGMTVTDEPGLYLEGQYGIRCENMLLVVPAFTTPMGEFLQFETLTLFPFDRKLIDPQLLDDAELSWLNAYHQRVAQTLLPLLQSSEQQWLLNATSQISKN